MRRPLIAFLIFLAAYLAVIGRLWFAQEGTGGELLGHAAKIEAILRLLQSGDFAWFPDYLTGSPSATLLSFALAVPVYAPALLLAPSPLIAMKITGLVLVALGGLAAFAFGRRFARDGWAGFAVGCAYLLAPQILLRLGWQEHMTIIVAVPLVPLAFWAMLRVAERGTIFDALFLAVSYSAALLAWSKMGATLALPLAGFAAWLFVSRPECRAHLVRGALWAVPVALLLGVLPLLPLLRERAFMAVFELDPFRDWQAAYSVKAATAWFDRGGALFEALPPEIRVDRGGYYLGLVGFFAVALAIFRTWRVGHDRPEIRAIRVFLLIALAMFWLSFGPRSVFEGHFELLTKAENLADLAIPLHWLSLAAQGVFLFWCLRPGRWRTPAFVVLFVLYLFVPAFPIVERLPLFGDLRAPDSFWILNGTFAWAVGSALALVFVLRDWAGPRRASLLAVAALIVACADAAPYFEWFRRGGLYPGFFRDFQRAGEVLRGASGRVLAASGRYYYLDVPNRFGRPLSTEALNHYLTPAAMNRLQAAARTSAENSVTYFRLAGIGDVLVERTDPDISTNTQRWFQALLPKQFENDAFFVLRNPASLYPGFFAESAVPAGAGYEQYLAALELARNQHLTIARDEGRPPENLPGMKSDADARATVGPEFLRLSLAKPRTAGTVAFTAPGRPGWVALDESWHPDWIATVDGLPADVYRAGGAFPAVPVDADAKVVEFRFVPPAWYGLCLGASGLGWIAALGLLAATPVLPRRLRARLAEPSAVVSPSPIDATARPAIIRPIAIVPTYNEAATIDVLIERILFGDPSIHVLVVDDGSPDGTASRVGAHPAFNDRVHLLGRAGKQGLGSAYREGFRWAIDRGYDACVEIDADLSHDPADIPKLLAALNAGADAAIGSRYLDGVRVINWPEHRLLLSAGASRYVRLLTGLPLTDATSGFKALRTAALRRLDQTQLRADGYGFQVELHWLLWTAGCRLVEVPIIFTERREGQTKMTLGIAFEAAWRVLQLGLRNLARQSPPAR